MNKRLLIVFLLGFSSGLPFAMLVGTLQAWFSTSGLSVMASGLLSLIGLPYSYRFLWGPLLDRFTLFSLGKRRSWILLMQILLLLGFNAMAWCSPQTSPGLMIFLAVLLACFSATQDTVIDAQRIEYLPNESHGLGASFAVVGYRIALFISGGLSLVMAQYWGFPMVYQLMGFLMVVGMIAIVISREPDSIPVMKQKTTLAFFIEPMQALFARSGATYFILFIVCYKFGEAFTGTMSGIVMPFLIQGIGFSLSTIGYVNKLMGIAALITGGLAAGFLLMRWSLDKALLVFGLFQASSSLLFIALAMVGKNIILFAVAVLWENLAAGMSSTALVVLMMRWVDRRFTATQFSMLVGFSMLPRAFSGPIAALIQSHLGWVGLYQCSFLLSLTFLPFLFSRTWDSNVYDHDSLPVETQAIDLIENK